MQEDATANIHRHTTPRQCRFQTLRRASRTPTELQPRSARPEGAEGFGPWCWEPCLLFQTHPCTRRLLRSAEATPGTPHLPPRQGAAHSPTHGSQRSTTPRTNTTFNSPFISCLLSQFRKAQRPCPKATKRRVSPGPPPPPRALAACPRPQHQWHGASRTGPSTPSSPLRDSANSSLPSLRLKRFHLKRREFVGKFGSVLKEMFARKP